MSAGPETVELREGKWVTVCCGVEPDEYVAPRDISLAGHVGMQAAHVVAVVSHADGCPVRFARGE